MARLIYVVGGSGSGKSTSLRNLNPEETVIINTDKKDLPFEEWMNLYSEEKMNYREVSTHGEILDTLEFANSNPKIKVAVVDTWNRGMTDYIYSDKFRSAADGRKAWGNFGLDQYNLLQHITRDFRKDLIVYLFCHKEVYKNDYGILLERIPAPGNMVNDLVPESFSSVVFYTQVEAIPGQRPNYYFRTVNSGFDTCKTPMGMFKEILIPNDLKEITMSIRNYFNI